MTEKEAYGQAFENGRAVGDAEGYARGLKEARVVDAVEVVRCKECAFWDDDRRCNGRKNGLVMEYTDGDDFCSYGERRNDNA